MTPEDAQRPGESLSGPGSRIPDYWDPPEEWDKEARRQAFELAMRDEALEHLGYTKDSDGVWRRKNGQDIPGRSD